MLELLAIFAAGFWAGMINVVVGSGTLVTFPVLLLFGYPPLVANVSNNIGLVGGGITGTFGYRAELAGRGRPLKRLLPASALGGVTGAVLLLVLPAEAFRAIVPALIAVGLIMVVWGPALQRRAARRREARQAAHALPGTGYVGYAQNRDSGQGHGRSSADGGGSAPGDWLGGTSGDGHGHAPRDGHDPGRSSGDGHGHAPGDGHGRTPGDGHGRTPGDGHGHAPSDGHGRTPGDGHGHASGDGHGVEVEVARRSALAEGSSASASDRGLRGGSGGAESAAGLDAEERSRVHQAAIIGGVFVLGIYGGYFGAAQGVLLVGLLSVLTTETLQSITGLKNLLTTAVNALAAVTFMIVSWHSVDWKVVLLIAAGATLGGVAGARFGRLLSPFLLRSLIVLVGVVALARLLFFD